MSEPLSASARRNMRKELVRLRLEMHRQQLRYNVQPLTHPLQQLRHADPAAAKTPLLVAAGVLLTLFGGRLGVFGKLARTALMLYPVVRGVQATQRSNIEQHHR
ncbi:hypothetical protein [Pseudomonas sp. Gutcm_11s]|uniref:hypothetical protein n=1 Tax=Pseudomonas sp. Gutcm_11s TaxID=3026088 RepID=UPI00235EA7C6|nr:hypothetical protein [Pseudomonas sp. Gutcm_11s]MDD0843909.1 hypothetical protein [Pseudomonas sp. Gutcm_11s]